MKVTQSCLILWDPMDYTVQGILHSKILEWVAIPFSSGSFQHRSPTLRVDSLPAEPPGKPTYIEGLYVLAIVICIVTIITQAISVKIACVTEDIKDEAKINHRATCCNRSHKWNQSYQYKHTVFNTCLLAFMYIYLLYTHMHLYTQCLCQSYLNKTGGKNKTYDCGKQS